MSKRAGIFIILLAWIYKYDYRSVNPNNLIKFLCKIYNIRYNPNDTINTFFTKLYNVEDKDTNLILFTNMCDYYNKNEINWQNKSNNWIVEEILQNVQYDTGNNE